MRTEQLSSPPNLTGLLAKAILTARTRRGGDLPDTELVLPNALADPARLAAYSRVCGFRLSGDLPPTYPHILGFPLAMRLMTDPGFPFALPGLVHASDQVTQHRPLPIEGPLELRVRADTLELTDRGTRFVVRTTAYTESVLVWQEESRYLRLEHGRTGGNNKSLESEPTTPTAIWRLPGDLGRRYAAVSGDHNPIHLYPVTSRLAGFRRPIAHGMWTLARCLAALEGRLPDAYTAEIRFRRPISLPATVGFRGRHTEAGWEIGVGNRSGEKTYVTGTIEAA